MSNYLQVFTRAAVSIMSWVWKNPTGLLIGWIGAWVMLLGYTLHTSDMVNVILLGTSGMLNIMSPVGLGLPILAVFLIFAQTLIPMLWQALEKAAYRIFRKVIDTMKKAVEAVQKLIQKIAGQIKKLTDSIAKLFGGSKKNLKAELQELAQNHGELMESLSQMDILAPEAAQHTMQIREASHAMVSEAVGVVRATDDESMLGAAETHIVQMEQFMYSELQALSESLGG